jgi:hypothetical protein
MQSCIHLFVHLQPTCQYNKKKVLRWSSHHSAQNKQNSPCCVLTAFVRGLFWPFSVLLHWNMTCRAEHTHVCCHFLYEQQCCMINCKYVARICRTLKADSYIACRAHAVPLPCCATKGLEYFSRLIYTVRPCMIHTSHAAPMPCSDHAVLLKATARRPVGYLPTFSFFQLPHRVPRR